MARVLVSAFAICLVKASALAQSPQTADSRTVLGTNEYLAAGADAIRAKLYDEGIRLTTIGLAQPTSARDRSAGLSNLCAAHAAKREADLAISFCTQSIELNESNWRAYSNRSYAYYLKGMDKEAHADLEMATTLSPNPEARQITQIRGMINERNLRPSVIMEDHR